MPPRRTFGFLYYLFVFGLIFAAALEGYWVLERYFFFSPREELREAWDSFAGKEREFDAYRRLLKTPLGGVLYFLGEISRGWGRPGLRVFLEAYDGERDPRAWAVAEKAVEVMESGEGGKRSAEAAEGLREYEEEVDREASRAAAGVVEAAFLCACCAALVGWGGWLGWRRVRRWLEGWRRVSTGVRVGEDWREGVWRLGVPLVPSWRVFFSREWWRLPSELRNARVRRVMRAVLAAKGFPEALDKRGAPVGDLGTHSLEVGWKCWERLGTEAAFLAGLLHDLGKRYSLAKEGGVWRRTGIPHDRASAVIAAGFVGGDREEVLCAVGIHHDPGALPLNAPEEAGEILAVLRKADREAAVSRTAGRGGS